MENPSPGHHYRRARANSPTVEVVREHDGSLAVTKSYAHCSPLYRQTVGSFAVSREAWALSRLQGSGHAPALLRRTSRFSVTMEHVPGIPVEELEPKSVNSDRLLEQADSLLRAFKTAGLVHGDLGHDHWGQWGRESNLIWSADQHLVAIDFSGSFPMGRGHAPWSKLSRALELHDQLLIPKLIHRFGLPTDRSVRTRSPAEISLAVWDLWQLLGKL